MRQDQLRAAFSGEFGDRVMFAKDKFNDAGIFFGQRRGVVGVVAFLPQLDAMSEAYSDDTFEDFVRALLLWGREVLSALDEGEDLDDAIDMAQQKIAITSPASLELLNFVFDL